MKLLRAWTQAALAYFQYMLAASHRHFGNKYGLRQEYEKAVDAYSRAIGYDPDFARAYMERGILFWRELDHPRRAVIDLTTAYELDPSLTEARFNRGVAHQELREYADALSDFRAYLSQGDHPYWREHAEKMIRELEEWTSTSGAGDTSS
jgi:tetratricopeptide (TPR) repeat protein